MSAEQFQTAEWATESWQTVVKTRAACLFRNIPVKNNFRSKEEGRDCYDNMLHIEIITSDPTLRIIRPVRDEDKANFAQEWAQWERTHESKIHGTSIDPWDGCDEAQKLELKFAKIFTLEQLAALPDSWGGKFMGFQDIRNKAIAYLRGGMESEAVKSLRAEKEAQSLQIVELMKRMAEMESLLTSKTEPDNKAKK